MAEVFAGIICGYGLALILTPVAAVALLRARVNSPLLDRVLPEGTSFVALSVILHGFALLTLTALGMLLGLLLSGLEESSPAGGLGSPNGVFTAFILATAAIAAGPLAIFAPRLRLPLLAGALLFAGLFGWLMPYLSLWGPDGG